MQDPRLSIISPEDPKNYYNKHNGMHWLSILLVLINSNKMIITFLFSWRPKKNECVHPFGIISHEDPNDYYNRHKEMHWLSTFRICQD